MLDHSTGSFHTNFYSADRNIKIRTNSDNKVYWQYHIKILQKFLTNISTENKNDNASNATLKDSLVANRAKIIIQRVAMVPRVRDIFIPIIAQQKE